MFLDVGLCYLFAFLITWYCRLAEIELGMRRGKCILFVSRVFVFFGVIVIFDGVCLFHFYLKKLTGEHRLMIVQKNKQNSSKPCNRA